MSSESFRDQQLRFLAFPQRPVGFREILGAGRNHFRLYWYLLGSVVTSYDQKPWGEHFLIESSPVASLIDRIM